MQTSKLESLTVKASIWTLFGYGTGQVLRFVGHVLAARFLTPADFGITQLTYVFIQGIQMFTDVGLGVNVLQHKKGDEPFFLQTAWTLQIIRGIILWLGTLILAWPLAHLYSAPQINWLLPLAGLSLLIEGFASTNLLLLNRKLEMKKLAGIELLSQFIGIGTMILCAWHWRSVWTLVVGGLVYSIIKTAISLIFFSNPKMCLRCNKEAVSAIQHFGKWIFVSSIVSFFSSRIDRLILGLFLTKTEFGLYGIASNFISIVIEILQILSNRVLLPIYSHLHHHAPHEMQVKVMRIRALLLGLAIPMLVFLAIFGQQIIHLLYKPAYYSAGWILQILAIGAIFKALTSTIMPILLAVGDSFRMMWINCIQTMLVIIALYIGGELFGIIGLIIAAALSEGAYYPLAALSVKRYGLWNPRLDLGLSFCAYLIIFLGLYIMHGGKLWT